LQNYENGRTVLPNPAIFLHDRVANTKSALWTGHQKIHISRYYNPWASTQHWKS